MDKKTPISDSLVGVLSDQEYIESIPGLKEKILEAGKTPIAECIPDDDVNWGAEIDPTGAELRPGDPERCQGNGKDPAFECCCDECDYYLDCYPDWGKEENEPMNNEDGIILPDKDEMEAFLKQVKEMERKIRSLSDEERYHVCDMGYLNDTIKGYLIYAMRESGFSREDIDKALGGLRWAFDDLTAKNAEDVYAKF